jgi:predicted phosphodiesterase
MLLSGDYNAEQDAVYKFSALRTWMNDDHVSMIESWGVKEVIDFGMQPVLLVHGSPADPTSGYVYPDTDLSVFSPEARLVFMGHSHYPFIRSHGGVRYVNVGSCGLPRDDGRFGSAALYDTVNGDARIIRFDITVATAEALESSGPVHRSVYDVLARRRDRIFGDMI